MADGPFKLFQKYSRLSVNPLGLYTWIFVYTLAIYLLPGGEDPSRRTVV